MEEFDQFEATITTQETKESEENNDKCLHTNFITNDGRVTCTDCGIEMNKDVISYDKDWKFNQGGGKKNNTRCTARTTDGRTILKDIVSLEVSDEVKFRANELFQLVSSGGIFRGTRRRALTYIVILEACKELERPSDMYYLQSYFKLTSNRHAISEAFKEYSLAITPKRSAEQKAKEPKYITAADLIPSLLRQMGADQAQIDKVLQMHTLVANKRQQLRVSKPQSVAAGVVWSYCQTTKKSISLDEFSKMAHISNLTITRNASEVQKVLNEVINRTNG